MSAIREVVETATIPLNPSHVRRHHHRLRRSGKCKGGKGGFHDVPSFPFEIINNQKDKRHVEDIWTRHVCPTITKLCYARTSFFINKNIRKTAFHSSMSNICSEFNRKTLNVKVEFQITILNTNNSNSSNQQDQQQTTKNNKTNKTTYALKFSRLSDISDSILNNVGQYCTAEIPDRIPDPVMAELIGPSPQEEEEEETEEEEEESMLVNNNSNNNMPNSHRSSSGRTTSSSASSSDAVGIVIDFVEDYSHQTTTRTTRSTTNTDSTPLHPAVVINNSPDPSMENLPILSAVAVAVVILDDNDNDDGNDNNEQACTMIRGEDEEEMIRMMNNNDGAAEPPPSIVTTAAAVYVETTIP